MTIRVPRVMPAVPRASRHHIGRPYTAALALSQAELVGHMAGAQMSHCLEAVFGSSESTTSTWRFLVYAGQNTRAVAVCIVPRGFVGSGTTYGTITVTGAEGEATRMVRLADGLVTDLGDIHDPSPFRFSVPVTAASLNEIEVICTDVRLHSMDCYEIPRAELTGTEHHVDRSIADPRQYITDNAAGSDRRGVQEMVNMPRRLRTIGNRHIWNLPCRPGMTSVGAGPDYLIGSAAAGDGPRVLARDVQGGGTTTTPVRCKVRADVVGAGTWTITYVFPGGTNATIVGVNATGWWPRAGGALVDLGATGSVAFADRVKVHATRTAGAGTITCDSFHVRESA